MRLSKSIEVKIADITKECCDAIVNAANSSLLGGGGVDGAIHRAGGDAVLNACRDIRSSRYPNGLPTGEAVATTSGDMCSKLLIHTAGPIYSKCGQKCESLLASCYTNSMRKAIELDCKSIAFPAISTGIYGYPKTEAAKIAYKTVLEFTQKHDIDVLFIFHSQSDYDTFVSAVKILKTIS